VFTTPLIQSAPQAPRKNENKTAKTLTLPTHHYSCENTPLKKSDTQISNIHPTKILQTPKAVYDRPALTGNSSYTAFLLYSEILAAFI